MLRFLADDGLLARVRYVSSVSGGSVAAGLFAMGYGRVGEEGFTRASSLLADAFDDWWFGGRHLTELPADLRWIINAASVTTGVRFAFERDVVGDYVVGRVRTAETFLRIGEAVASSAAVPGARAPFEVKGANFPCAQGHQVKLLDGCVYDNIGLQGSTARLAPLVAINAGGHFRTGAYGKLPTSAISSARTRCCTGSRRQFAGSSWSTWEEARDAGRPAPDWGRLRLLFDRPASPWERLEWGRSRARVAPVGAAQRAVVGRC